MTTTTPMSTKAPFSSSVSSSLLFPHQAVSPVVDLTRELIRRPSLTPQDSGCQDLIAERLKKLGFVTETLQYHNVTNLWAFRNHGNNQENKGRRLVMFAGHTDVVPAGPVEAWTHPPFEGVIAVDCDSEGDEAQHYSLYGRGAVDMKGGVAAFIVALENFLSANPQFDGSIGVLLTSDEEGDAEYGTKLVIQELLKRGLITRDTMCIVGEPASLNQVGDTVKLGRRGSLGGELTIHGIQGHVAYPHLAKNPIHESLGALKDMIDMHWDDGTPDFHPTTFQITNIVGGTGARNVIPGFKKVHFNFRFSPASTVVGLQQHVQAVLDNHNLEYDINWHDISHPYETPWDCELVHAALASVTEVTGLAGRTCTSGGTSDGRFVAATGAQVVEIGLLSHTIHKVDEHCRLEDLEILTSIYVNLLRRLLKVSEYQ